MDEAGAQPGHLGVSVERRSQLVAAYRYRPYIQSIAEAVKGHPCCSISAKIQPLITRYWVSWLCKVQHLLCTSE